MCSHNNSVLLLSHFADTNLRFKELSLIWQLRQSIIYLQLLSNHIELPFQSVLKLFYFTSPIVSNETLVLRYLFEIYFQIIYSAHKWNSEPSVLEPKFPYYVMAMIFAIV